MPSFGSMNMLGTRSHHRSFGHYGARLLRMGERRRMMQRRRHAQRKAQRQSEKKIQRAPSSTRAARAVLPPLDLTPRIARFHATRDPHAARRAFLAGMDPVDLPLASPMRYTPPPPRPTPKVAARRTKGVDRSSPTPQIPRRKLRDRLVSWATGGWSGFRIAVTEDAQDTRTLSPLERAVLEHTGEDISPKRTRTRDATRRDTTRAQDADSDLVDALVSLGFKKPLARSLASRVTEDMPLEDAVRLALSYHQTR